ncbi:MAG: hypothetical protein JWN24_1686 [Phycisphaerales bacterium]|nr:hypothetical protein [Phycisphaerales bacterium]
MAAKLRIAGTEATPTKLVRTPEERWTKRLIKKGGGFTPISVYFLKNYYRLLPELTSAEVVVLIHLMSYKWDAEMPYPGSNALAERMGISATAVRGHLRSLHKSKKCLIRHVRIGTTNAYDLRPLFKKLETLMDADEVAAAKKSPKAAVA